MQMTILTYVKTRFNLYFLRCVCQQVAARNCRKRKIDQIRQLEDDVTRIKTQKMDLNQQHKALIAEARQWTSVVKRLHDHVLKVS